MEGKPVQITLFEYLETLQQKDEPVQIKGAINIKTLKQFEVTCSYGDIVLIISMLRDYVKGLDEIKHGNIDWEAYYRNKFLKMADRLSEQIGYDYDKALEKCLKKAEKAAKDDDIGEEALVLALKKGAAKKKEESKDDTRNQDQEDIHRTNTHRTEELRDQEERQRLPEGGQDPL